MAWKDCDHNAINDEGMNSFIYDFGKDGILFYQKNHYKDLDINSMFRGHTESKRWWLLNIQLRDKEVTFPQLFRKLIRQTQRNNSAVQNCKENYFTFSHRINSISTDAMVVETGNGKLTVLFGLFRNLGMKGINEAGQIAINGLHVSEWDP